MTFLWHLCWIRDLAAGEEEEDEEDEGIEAEPHLNSPSDVPAATADDRKQQKGEADDLAEYELDKYDEEDAGRNYLRIFILSVFVYFPVCGFSPVCLSLPPRAYTTCFPLVTANLGDSLAGLTVFSSNEEDPYITLKDTVSTLIASPVHILLTNFVSMKM